MRRRTRPRAKPLDIGTIVRKVLDEDLEAARRTDVVARVARAATWAALSEAGAVAAEARPGAPGAAPTGGPRERLRAA
eukprot:2615710-Pleurochrysis_carterae.AAC.1